ncbi:MAG: hypothetical protein IH623_05120 [Verrucomicrobia bacterium]|nr:hypothetical protein [Verrucomicrobiota bacterium]
MLTLVVLMIAALACARLSEKPIPEPRHQGKSLSEWMEIHRMARVLSGSRTEPASTKAERVAAFRAREARVAATRAEAELAVRSIGTNALPCLLAWLRYELPSWRKGLLKLATRPVEGKTLDEGNIVYGRSLIIGPTARNAEWADLGFVILNTNAAPAIPELEAMMKDNQKPDRGLRAIYALGAIGVPAVRVLTNALADTNQTHRCEIMSAFYVVREMSPPSRDTYLGACLPALNRALDDADADVRRQAKVSLYNIEHWDEILAQAKSVGAFWKHGHLARTNAPKPDVEVFPNAPAK